MEYLVANHYDAVVNGLTTPYGFSIYKRMRFIHGYDDDENTEDENPLAFVCEEDFFIEFE